MVVGKNAGVLGARVRGSSARLRCSLAGPGMPMAMVFSRRDRARRPAGGFFAFSQMGRTEIRLGSVKKSLWPMRATQPSSCARRSHGESIGRGAKAGARNCPDLPRFRQAGAGGARKGRRERRAPTSGCDPDGYAFRKIGDLPVHKTEGPAIGEVLVPIWLSKPETARRVRQRLGTVLDWACAKGFRATEAPLHRIWVLRHRRWRTSAGRARELLACASFSPASRSRRDPRSAMAGLCPGDGANRADWAKPFHVRTL